VTTTTPPPLDPIAQEYAALAFGIERHIPGYVDAYVGPPEPRHEAAAGEPAAPAELLATARQLAIQVAEAPIPEERVGFLTAQLAAMITICRKLTGEEFAYSDEVRLLFDIEPTRTPEATFDAAITALDRLLPGRGDVAERMIAWRQLRQVTPETARRLIDLLVPEIRRRTQAMVELPPGEEVEFRFVTDQPWSGYNWFLGGGRSRVELNTDLPIDASRLPGLLCHEAYPGHHVEHSLKEAILYHVQGRGEHAIHLINTPECVISEGIATLAEVAIFPPEESIRVRAEVVFPAIGLAADPAQEVAIGQALGALRGVAGNAALLRHEEGRPAAEVIDFLRRYGLVSDGEAQQRLRFIDDPLWRPYIFTYHAGHDLLGAWLEAAPPASRSARFRRLLTEQVSPSQVGRWLAADGADLSPPSTRPSPD